MKKRVISLLVLAIVMATAPAAMANHCFKCRAITLACVVAPNNGYDACWGGGEDCILGEPCGDHAAAPVQPLAAEFEVASVERLDEPQTGTSETRVASAEPAPYAHR